MRIAILGGTGDIGEGLTLRWARDTTHELLVGSREAEHGQRAATDYTERLTKRGLECEIRGFENADAAARADVIVLSVPPYYVSDTIEAVETVIDDAILVTPAVGIEHDETGFHYEPPPTGSITAYAAKTAPDTVPVVGAFHNLPASRLADLNDPLGFDTPVLADDNDAKETVLGLISEMEGVRGIDAGGIANAPEAEGLVPLLLNIAEHAGLEHPSLQFK